MQKGYYFFLILVLASAVILGSTIGLISNVSYIVQNTELLKPQPNEVFPDGHAHDSVSPTPQSNIPGSLQGEKQPLSTSSGDSEYMVLSQEEKEQIKQMLFGLGMGENDDLGQFVLEFQKKNSLETTGILDSQTLDIIIKQSTLQEVSRSLNRGINV